MALDAYARRTGIMLACDCYERMTVHSVTTAHKVQRTLQSPMLGAWHGVQCIAVNEQLTCPNDESLHGHLTSMVRAVRKMAELIDMLFWM